jgi:hypothetical protein
MQVLKHLRAEDYAEWLLSLFYVIVLFLAILLLRRNERNFPEFKIRARLLFCSVVLLVAGERAEKKTLTPSIPFLFFFFVSDSRFFFICQFEWFTLE